MSKRIFIAATQQNAGKTTVSLGLIYCLKKYFKNIGFIKPVGQRYLLEQGYQIDEDSILMEHVYHLKDALHDMSPVAVERGFTERYIKKPERPLLVRQIKEGFRHVSRNNELVVIEGTGHAGVGSVFDLSNASVARLLKSKVILIASGGVGRPIDEVVLNKALFDRENVEILGVIINKIHPDKYEKISKLVRLGLGRKKLPLLGVIPYEPALSKPNMAQIKDELGAEVLFGESFLSSSVENIVIGAMEPHDALNYIEHKSLIITPGDREDLIITAISKHLISDDYPSVAGLLLTGNIRPHSSVLELFKSTDIPVLLVKEDTYSAASRVHDLKVKIRPEDKTKTNIVLDLVNRYVDIDSIVNQL